MAKSLWIKPKHGGQHKEELSPVTIVVAGALLAFGFSVYFLYHILKKPVVPPSTIDELSSEARRVREHAMSGTATGTQFYTEKQEKKVIKSMSGDLSKEQTYTPDDMQRAIDAMSGH